jgi:leucyl aminopeptidase
VTWDRRGLAHGLVIIIIITTLLQEGGSITAALFLSEFVKKTPWAHLDIAGPVWNGKKGGATGFGVRTLTEWIVSHSTP